MQMALRDEIDAKNNKLADLAKWLAKQDNEPEWWDVLRDIESFSNHSIAKLLTKHGFSCDWNVVYRFRQKHVA
jgi:hypothetical protein